MEGFDFRGREQSGIDPLIEDLATEAIGAAIDVHRILGSGLPEKVYRNALSHELSLRNIPHRVEAPVPIHYKGLLVGEGSVDILVADTLVLELKVVESLNDVHVAQVIAYLQALHLPLGVLINFNVLLLKEGLKRVVRTRS